MTSLTLNLGAGVIDTYSGNIADGAAGMTVTKNGTGTQILSGTNTYTGNTTINGGTLTIGGSGTLGTGTYAAGIANNGSFIFNSSAS